MALVQKVKLEQRPFIELKLEGLKRRNPNKVEYILQIEKLLTDYRYACYSLNKADSKKAMDELIDTLLFMIDKKAKAWGRRWFNKRLSTSDFKSIFFDTVWKLCDTYEWYSEFYFYETLILALKRKAISVINRATKTKQGRFESSALPLKDETADFIPDKRVNVENYVIDRVTVERLLKEASLTDQERRLLQIIYANPDFSYRELAIRMGLNYHTEITRSLKKIYKKVFHLL